jgi:TM2 domain-containing membrane protein YozV
MNKALIVLLMMLFTGSVFSVTSSPASLPSFKQNENILTPDSLKTDSISAVNAEVFLKRTFPRMSEDKRKRVISAMLAFPFPFGFMGAHRVMLGCKPWIPVVYVATFGGCFGLLPLIDFIAIVGSKDIEQYENNPHVFMWLK